MHTTLAIRCRTLSAALALIAGCSSAASQHTYIAPTPETVVTRTEERRGDPPQHLIFVENHSTVPITVFSLSLTACENVKHQCGPRPMSLRIAPGSQQVVLRVEPDKPGRGFSYRFGYNWRVDSANVAALSALAAAGDESAQRQLAARQRADSMARTEWGSRYRELTRPDFAALAGRAATLRPYPDSLVLTPGEQRSIQGIQLLVVDSQGVVFGRTGWIRWMVPSTNAVQFIPPDRIIARAPARVYARFRLAEEAEAALGQPMPETEVPIVVAYPPNPRAPTFTGVTVDADTKMPLTCASVVLEDSAQNTVVRGHTAKAGAFSLKAPRAGTYRVSVYAHGWWPVHGPPTRAAEGDTVEQEIPVRFTEQMIVARRYTVGGEEIEHAYPVAVSTGPVGGRQGSLSIAQSITLGGSESMPILGIIGSAPAGTTWMQFVVDSTGAVDSASVTLPAGTSEAAMASVRFMLPRIRFSPAREAGRPTCELLRMQVNFSPR
jgi:hypothetical protein